MQGPLKKLLSAGVEVTANLQNSDTCKAFIQICLTSTLFCLINKTGTYHIKAFEYPFIFLSGRDKQISSNLPFVAISITFLSGNTYIVRKKVSKLRFIAELRAFVGTHD